MIRAVVGVGVALLVAGGSGENRAPAPLREVEIVAHDYAFVAPRELSAGETTFRFTNKGKVAHELAVELLKPGTTPQAIMAALNSKVPLTPLIESGVGILIARPGHRSSVGLATHLLEGRTYLLICRFQDGSAPRHSRLGMIAMIAVVPARVARVRVVRIDTIIGVDYAFEAPRTLAAGRHTLTFANGGKVLHELNVALLRPGVDPAHAFRVMKENGEIDLLVEEWLGVLFARGGESTIGKLEVNLLPNRDYVISCGLSNADGAPAHQTLGMLGHVRTRKRTP